MPLRVGAFLLIVGCFVREVNYAVWVNKFSEDGYSGQAADSESDVFSKRKPRRQYEEYTAEMLSNAAEVAKSKTGSDKSGKSEKFSKSGKSGRNVARVNERSGERSHEDSGDGVRESVRGGKRGGQKRSQRSRTNPDSPNNVAGSHGGGRSSSRPPKAPTGNEHLLGTRIELVVSGFAHGGFGVARTDEGRVVFVSDAIPGETVAVLISDVSNKSFWYADTVEVLVASPDRVEHFWPEASVTRHPSVRAGGANLGHVVLDRQRRLKSEVLADALRRFGKLSEENIQGLFSQSEQVVFPGFPEASDSELFVRPLHDDNGLHWRTRIKLRADVEGNLGVFSPRTHQHVAIDSFPLATTQLLENAPLGQQFEGISSLELISSSTNEHRLMIDDVPSSRVLHEDVSWTKPDGSTAEHTFELSENGFWQVHADAPRALAQVVSTLIDPSLNGKNALNLDLYAGVGLFTAVLTETLGTDAHVLSVEIDRKASSFADKNLQNFPNVSVVNDDVQRFLIQEARKVASEDGADLAQSYRHGTVLLDPPRSGAGRKVVEQLGRLRPAQVVYVACDPVALARDVQYFTRQGFELVKLVSLDMFPNTHHFESVAVFV